MWVDQLRYGACSVRITGTIMNEMSDKTASLIRETLTPLSPIPTDVAPRMNPSVKIRALLFDIYGTLLISGTGDIGIATRQPEAFGMEGILSESGITARDGDISISVQQELEKNIEECHQELRQLGVDYPEVEIRTIWRKTLSALKSESLLNVESGDDFVEMLALRHELALNPVWPMPGFPEIISRLKSAGYRTGIVSNAQFYTPIILEALTGQTLSQIGFENSLCAWSFESARAKPSPEVFKKPLERLAADGISPSEVLYIGNDMLNDVAAASANGCVTALFAGDRRSLRLREGDERADTAPDMIITELSQLEMLIPKGASDGN
jgi:putative hydrolase of the HAD superfamily